MKKLIAISVMCALVVGAAFADTTFGGAIFVGGQFVNGDNVEGSHLQTLAIDKDAYNTIIKTTFGDSDAGGWFSLHNNGGNANPYHWFGWWKPIPQVRLQIGRNTDGDFGAAQITGWGFTSETKNAAGNGMGAINEYSGPVFGLAHPRQTAWYQGTGDTPNFQISAFPIEGLTVNLWIPFNSGEAVALTYSRIELNVVYRIIDIGTVNVAYQSNTGYIEGDPEGKAWYGKDGITDPAKSGKIFASFYLSAIENMGVELAIAYKLPFNESAFKYKVSGGDDYWDEGTMSWVTPDEVEKTTEFKTTNPFEIGIGFRYTMGDFQVKLRSGISVGGGTEYADGYKDPTSNPTQISVNILPNYTIKNVTLYFYAGMGIQIADYEEGDGSQRDINESSALISWFINPYVMFRAGGLRFLTGVQIYSNGDKFADEGGKTGAKIDWAIPFGFYTYF